MLGGEDQNRFPVLRTERRAKNTFNGTRKAYIAIQEKRAEMARRTMSKEWNQEDRQRELKYKKMVDMLRTNVKLRSDEYLRRQNKPRPIGGVLVIPRTTGTRENRIKLPRDVQSSLYPRHYRFYFGQ